VNKKENTMHQDKRKKVLGENKKKRFRFELLIPILVLVIGGTWIIVKKAGGGNGSTGNTFVKYERIKADDGIVSLPLSNFEDGKAKYFRYKFPEKEIVFFVVKSGDGIVRAAFDACDVCYDAKKGYRQEGDIMVCNNCDQEFPTDRINVEKGGCNPSPLERSISGDQLVVQVSDLYKGIRYF